MALSRRKTSSSNSTTCDAAVIGIGVVLVGIIIIIIIIPFVNIHNKYKVLRKLFKLLLDILFDGFRMLIKTPDSSPSWSRSGGGGSPSRQQTRLR